MKSKNNRSATIGGHGITPSSEEKVKVLLNATNYKMDRKLVNFISDNYQPILKEVLKDNSLVLYFRKGGRALCSIEVENGLIRICLVLGKKEAKEAKEAKEKIQSFSPKLQEIFTKAKEFFDGRWLFIEVKDGSTEKEIEALLTIKRRPKKVPKE